MQGSISWPRDHDLSQNQVRCLTHWPSRHPWYNIYFWFLKRSFEGRHYPHLTENKLSPSSEPLSLLLPRGLRLWLLKFSTPSFHQPASSQGPRRQGDCQWGACKIPFLRFSGNLRTLSPPSGRPSVSSRPPQGTERDPLLGQSSALQILLTGPLGLAANTKGSQTVAHTGPPRPSFWTKLRTIQIFVERRYSHSPWVWCRDKGFSPGFWRPKLKSSNWCGGSWGFQQLIGERPLPTDKVNRSTEACQI